MFADFFDYLSATIDGASLADGRRLDAWMPLSDNLLRLRVTDGKSIDEVADGAKVPPALIEAIESGRPSVPHKSLKALAAYFGVSVATLLR